MNKLFVVRRNSVVQGTGVRGALAEDYQAPTCCTAARRRRNLAGARKVTGLNSRHDAMYRSRGSNLGAGVMRTSQSDDPLTDRIYLEESSKDIVNPEPLPVIHSAAFMQRKRGVWKDGEASTSTDGKSGSVPSSGVEWFVNSVDEKLNTVEASGAPKVAEAFSEAISSETGKNVRKGMVQAAKLTAEAGVVVAKGAAKGAVPVVSWVVKNGTKAIISSATNSTNKKGKKS